MFASAVRFALERSGALSTPAAYEALLRAATNPSATASLEPLDLAKEMLVRERPPQLLQPLLMEAVLASLHQAPVALQRRALQDVTLLCLTPANRQELLKMPSWPHWIIKARTNAHLRGATGVSALFFLSRFCLAKSQGPTPAPSRFLSSSTPLFRSGDGPV